MAIYYHNAELEVWGDIWAKNDIDKFNIITNQLEIVSEKATHRYLEHRERELQMDGILVFFVVIDNSLLMFKIHPSISQQQSEQI